MTVTLMRMEDMSLFHYIKDVIIPIKWVEKVVDCPLVYDNDRARFEAQIIWLPNFLEEGRGWVYFDRQGADTCITNSPPDSEQTTRVTVYNESGAVIDPSHYTINYKDGAIIASGGTSTPDGVPTTVDFHQYYVSVIDGWPGTEPPEPPIVAIDITGFDKRPFQLGGGRKSVRKVTLHVFATSSSERDDLTEWLHDAVFQRSVAVLDYRNGEPLNYDGTFNTNWTADLLTLNNNDDALFKFDDVKVEYISARQDWSDLNRWRSKVSFTMTSYRDGIDLNALS
jgi:hypothetical protein